jgi:hypothetical protein
VMMCRSQSGRTRWGPGGRGKPPNVGVVGRWRDQPTVDDERVFHDTEREHQVRHRFVLNKCSRGMPDQPKHYPSPTTAGRLPGVVVVGRECGRAQQRWRSVRPLYWRLSRPTGQRAVALRQFADLRRVFVPECRDRSDVH